MMSTLTDLTQGAVQMLYHSARRMPKDKLTWSPLGAGRTVLEQLQECALAPDMYLRYLDPNYRPVYSSPEEAMQGARDLNSLEACEKRTLEQTARLCEVIDALTSDDLVKVHRMHWGGELPGSIVAGLHYWNLTYHLGQINYIQTLYGDKTML